MKTKFTFAAVLAAALLLAPMASAQPPIADVPAGLDLWQTLGSGATSYSFANDPLPADFFCTGSKAFTGRIDFEGVPMGGALGSTDTIIERLGTATFDADGVARGQIRPRALNLVGSQKIATSCGEWSVRADLTRHQPVSDITFYRQNKFGGVFDSDLRINVRLTFDNQSTGARHQLVRQMNLPTKQSIAYACFQQAQPVGTTSNLIAARNLAIADFEARRGGQSHATRTKEVITNTHGTVDTGSTSPTRVAGASDACITGYACNPNDADDCMYIYSWHQPEEDERHFTATPCRLGYQQFCDDAEVEINNRVQLNELRELGILNVPVDQVLERQSAPRIQK